MLAFDSVRGGILRGSYNGGGWNNQEVSSIGMATPSNGMDMSGSRMAMLIRWFAMPIK